MGINLDQGLAHGNLARGMAQLGPGAGLNLDLDGAHPGISGSSVSLRGRLRAGRNFKPS